MRVIHQIDGHIADARRLEQQHILTENEKDKQALGAQLAKIRDDVRQRLKDYELLVADDDDRALLKTVGQGGRLKLSRRPAEVAQGV